MPALTAPSASELDSALRAAVQDIYRTGDFEDLTVRRIRSVVEREKGLSEGFFKSPEAGWKERSKGVIEGAVVSSFLLGVWVLGKRGWGGGKGMLADGLLGGMCCEGGAGGESGWFCGGDAG